MAVVEHLEFLIREGARLKGEIDRALLKLRKINLELAESARFENGKHTAYLLGAGYKVKVRKQENIAWDQEKLLKLREYLPEGKFGELFKVVYEPTSKRMIDGFIAHGDPDLVDGLKWCMSIKPRAPQVIYEKVGNSGRHAEPDKFDLCTEVLKEINTLMVEFFSVHTGVEPK